MNPFQKICETTKLLFNPDFWKMCWDFTIHVIVPSIWPVMLYVLASFVVAAIIVNRLPEKQEYKQQSQENLVTAKTTRAKKAS